MKRLIISAGLCLMATTGGVLAQKSNAAIQAEITATLQPGCNGCITATNMAGILNDMVLSYLNTSSGAAANSVKGNATGAPAALTDLPMPSCSGASSALTWTTNSGFGCNNIAGGGTPGGANNQIQFNNGGSFGGFTASSDITINVGTGAVTIATSSISNNKLTTAAGNTLKGNTSNISATPTDVAVPSCSGTSSALTWTLGSGFGCNNISSGGTPASPTSSIQYNNAGAFGAVSSIVSTNGYVTLGGSTITANDPILNLSQTWNSGGTTFTGIKYNATNTASASASLLADLQLGGNSAFSVREDGTVLVGQPTGSGGTRLQFAAFGDSRYVNAAAASGFVDISGAMNVDVNTPRVNVGPTFTLSSGNPGGSGNGDSGLSRAAAKVLEFSDGSANANGWYNYAGQTRVTADAPTVNSTLTNVTGLSVSLAAGRTYGFDVYMNVTDAAAAGVQTAMSASGGLTATAIEYDGWIQDANAIKGMGTATALSTVVASSITTNTSGIVVMIKGTITVNAAGTLNVQAAQTLNNGTATTIKRGSRMYVEDMQ